MKPKLTHICVLLSILILGACKSLPLPGTPTESLFVLSGSVDKTFRSREGENRTIERVVLTIENVDTGKKKLVTYYPKKSFVALPLEPGRYRIQNEVDVDVNNGRGNWTETKRIHSNPFQIEETTVFISPLILNLKRNTGPWYNVIVYSSNTNTNQIRIKAVEELLKDRRYKAWELYQVVGWEVEEE